MMLSQLLLSWFCVGLLAYSLLMSFRMLVYKDYPQDHDKMSLLRGFLFTLALGPLAIPVAIALWNMNKYEFGICKFERKKSLKDYLALHKDRCLEGCVVVTISIFYFSILKGNCIKTGGDSNG